MVSVVFFTVTRSRDYDYLLGSIEQHAEMGRHLVLDTTFPPEEAIKFNKLPNTVRWIHEPVYGSGWKEFRLRTAAERARVLAGGMGADVLVYMDSDDFYTPESKNNLFPHALDAIVEIQYTHWRKDGYPYIFGESEWHKKLWPSWGDTIIGLNSAWHCHKDYNGNPEHHALAYDPTNIPMIRVLGNFRHHVHYAIGPNADDDETARTTISGWPDKGFRVPSVPWPPKLALWRDKGIRPSEFFR